MRPRPGLVCCLSQNPLKPAAGLLNELSPRLVQLAVEGETNLRVSDIEFKLPRPSFTIDTLTYLGEKYPQHEFAVIMGSDSFQNLPSWKNHELLLRNYGFIIYQRGPGAPGYQRLAQCANRESAYWFRLHIRNLVKTDRIDPLKGRSIIIGQSLKEGLFRLAKRMAGMIIHQVFLHYRFRMRRTLWNVRKHSYGP